MMFCVTNIYSEVSSRVTQLKDRVSDRRVLAELYEALGGRSWKDGGKWLGPESLGEWHGITTDERGFVTEIKLCNNHVRGESVYLLCPVCWILKNYLAVFSVLF